MRHTAHGSKDGPLDLGRWAACFLLFVLSLIGIAALLVPFAFRLPSVRAWIERNAVAAVKDETGLTVHMEIDRPLWPLGVVVRGVQVESTDPRRPFATIREARVTLRPFSLLSGDVVIDGVEVDGLVVDAEMREGQPIPTNLPLKLKPHAPKAPTGPALDPPFRVVSLTGAQVKVTYARDADAPGDRPMSAELDGIDLDIDAATEGESTIYNLRLQKAVGAVRTPRTQLSPPPLDRFSKGKIKFDPHEVWDEDAICGLAVDVQVTDSVLSDLVSLRHFEVDAHLDGNEALGTAPSCSETEIDDEQVAHLRLDRVAFAAGKGASPSVVRVGPAGKLRVQAPALLAARYVKLPPVGGYVSIDLDLAAEIDLKDPLPGVLRAATSGRLEGHQLRFAQFRFGESVSGDIAVKPPLIIASKKIDVVYADGQVTLTDLEIKAAPAPLQKKQMPMHVGLAIKGVKFPGLMRELGVSKAAHVRWDIDEGTAKIAGYLSPLALDGDLALKTDHFELAQRAVEDANPGHIIGVKEPVAFSTHVVIRDTHLGFEQVRTRWGNTSLAARVLIGFDDRLEVDASSEQFDLADISPLVQFKLGGIAKLDWKVRGMSFDPISEGKLSILGFVFDDFALGDVETATAKAKGTLIDVESYRAHIQESAYQVSSMRIDLGAVKGSPIFVDALASSDNFDLDDFYGIFKLQDDPRWKDIQGHFAFDSRAHFVVGGKDDPCGTGHLQLDLGAQVLAMDLWGERYDGGTADLSIDWYDLQAGGLGMDLGLRAATLKKKGGGTIVAAGKIERGGVLNIHATVGGLSLKSLSAVPQTTIAVDGAIDAVADVGGTFDDMTVDADVSVSPILIGDQTLDRSHLHVVRAPVAGIAPAPRPDARGCYTGRKLPPFDAVRYFNDPVEGSFVISGDMFGGTVKLQDFSVTDQKKMVAEGKIEIRRLDLGPLALLRPRADEADLDDKYEPPPPPVVVDGKGSADIVLVRFPIDEWWNAKGSIANLTLDVESGDLGVATSGETPKITFGPEGAELPETTLNVHVGDAAAKIILAARVDRTSVAPDASPKLVAKVTIPDLPLSRLEQYFPRIERADGLMHATVVIGGTVAAPTWEGELAIANGAMTVKGLALPISAVNGKISVDPRTGLRIEKLHGEVGGGTIDVTGGATLRGFQLGDVDMRVVAKEVHFRYADAMSTTFGGELHATWSPPETSGGKSEPARIEGFVDIDSFLYEKPVKVFDVNAIQAAQRTDVQVYDPLRDVVAFDIELRAKHGLRFRNNLVDATMVVGQGGLRAVGTNQRYGLLGDVLVVQGGVFKFRNHDFEIREGALRFADDTKIEPNIDVVAITDYRRAAGTGSIAEWRIKLHAYGVSNDLKLELTSDPPLSQEDAILLLTIGMTRAEANSLGGGVVAGGAGIDFLADVAGVDQTVKQAIPVIDDFRFGTAYSVKTGRTEPQVTLGKRLTDTLRASITSGFGENRQVLSNIEWQLSRKLSLQGSYDNVNDVSTASVGNVGIDLRFRLEFE